MKPTVAVIGAGAGGIAMGVQLTRGGYDFTIYEAGDGFGGTWRHNTYPGATCDVPSHLYSFSFALNPLWSKTYATQPEILAYLERVAADYGLGERLRARTRITEARWSDGDQRWTLVASDGEQLSADVVISALGMLDIAQIPDIPGADRFHGRAFHSSRWDHSRPVTGERVASIGTGASAIQYVPAIAPEVSALTVFQRTPIWVSPRRDTPFTPEQHEIFSRKRFAARRLRWQVWWTYERSSFAADSPQTIAQTELARSYLERKIADPELRAKLTPDYPVGCKRPLMSRDWFPALTQPHVRLVTEPIVEFTERGLRTADGEEHEVDTVIYGTGFTARSYLSGLEVYGAGGRRLHDDWRAGAEAYLGTTVAGYPNLFVLFGPNTNGVNSILFIHEAQAHHVRKALDTMRRFRIRSVEVRRRTMERYNARLQAAMTGKVWLAGCTSYYVDPSGKVVTQLPYSGGRFWLRLRIFPWWRFRLRR